MMRETAKSVTGSLKRAGQALVIGAALFALIPVARAPDTQDIIVEWTPEGKALAEQRVAR